MLTDLERKILTDALFFYYPHILQGRKMNPEDEAAIQTLATKLGIDLPMKGTEEVADKIDKLASVLHERGFIEEARQLSLI
jgi:hypothetical protein